MSARMESACVRGCAARQMSEGGRAAARRWAGLLVMVFLITLSGTAFGQFTNEITEVNPNSAPPGTNGLLVSFTLDTDFPPPPPPGDGPQSVMIGGISGTDITHTTSSSVTAVFDIPAAELEGSRDIEISFEVPGGTLVFSLVGGFTVGGCNGEEYDIERTLGDGAQRNTIAFDGLAFLTGCLGAQSFLPPGKVADYNGFQYLRDNDPTCMGHNTDFVTIIAFNVLHILTDSQISQLLEGAYSQVDLINEYAYERFPLMEAFRRQFEGDLPPGSTGLDKEAVMEYSAYVYRIDGQISHGRAKILGGVLRDMTPVQVAAMDSLVALNGVGHWDNTLTDPLHDLQLEPDVHVAVMTYASEMYSWYAGSVEVDVYFCPERQGTYFGSFYLKDWPCMGNPDCDIDEQLTTTAGEEFLAILADSQSTMVTDLVDIQRDDLYEIVERRHDISTQLRRFMTEENIDSVAVIELSERYGELDGEIVYYYATHFAEVGQSLDTGQWEALEALADSLRYVPPEGAFLYSEPIQMPNIPDTDFLFDGSLQSVGEGVPGGINPPTGLSLSLAPNPAVRDLSVAFVLPAASRAQVVIYDVTGRVVRVLDDSRFTAGAHRVSWNGRDDQGRIMPAGVYVARLDTSYGTRSSKFTIIR